VGRFLLISNSSVTFSFHGPQGSSLPLFSPCNFDLSNANHDDDVMSLYEFDPALETNIPIIPFKSTIPKKIYDALKKNSRFLGCKTTMGIIMFRLK